MYLGFYFIFFTANHSYISVLQVWRRSPTVTIASVGVTFISSFSANIAVTLKEVRPSVIWWPYLIYHHYWVYQLQGIHSASLNHEKGIFKPVQSVKGSHFRSRLDTPDVIQDWTRQMSFKIGSTDVIQGSQKAFRGSSI